MFISDSHQEDIKHVKSIVATRKAYMRIKCTIDLCITLIGTGKQG